MYEMLNILLFSFKDLWHFHLYSVRTMMYASNEAISARVPASSERERPENGTTVEDDTAPDNTMKGRYRKSRVP